MHKEKLYPILLTVAAIALIFLSYNRLTGSMLYTSYWMIAGVIIIADQVQIVYTQRKAALDAIVAGKESSSSRGGGIACIINAVVGMVALWQMWARLSAWYLMTPLLYIAISCRIGKKIMSDKMPSENITMLTAANLFLFSSLLFIQLLLG